MKVIFLDFDGVICTARAEWGLNPDFRGALIKMLDPIGIGFLNRLVELTGCAVVVSSTWRLGRTVEELQNILSDAGFNGKVIGKTIWMKEPHCRGNEIDDYLHKHPEIKDYVIIDDDWDFLPYQFRNFVQTDSSWGMDCEHFFLAATILGHKGWGWSNDYEKKREEVFKFHQARNKNSNAVVDNTNGVTGCEQSIEPQAVPVKN
jgi:hypothetical protein